MGNYCCDCLFGSNDHNHNYESLNSQEVTQLRSGRNREISLDNYQSIIDQASRSKLGDANVNASIVSTPPSNGLLINVKQSHTGYNYYTNSNHNAGSGSSSSSSSSSSSCSMGNIGGKGISSDFTQGSSNINAAVATATTATVNNSIDTNINASLIQSIETIADDVYNTISNDINKNHAFSSIKNNRGSNSNNNSINSDATVISFKPFEDSTCNIIHS